MKNKGIVTIEEWIGDFLLNGEKKEVVKLNCEQKKIDSSEEEEWNKFFKFMKKMK